MISCSTATLGLAETNDEDQINDRIICSLPIMMKNPDEIVPIDLNLSNGNRTQLIQIIKVIYFLIIFQSIHFV